MDGIQLATSASHLYELGQPLIMIDIVGNNHMHTALVP